MANLRDLAFQATFSRIFVYNILFEDAEVDERYLRIKEDSTILGITGAGCGIAGLVSQQPRRIDAVDINRHHLALAALKATAAQRMSSYTQFYDLLGRGWQPEPDKTLQRITGTMPDWMQTYWRRHHGRFKRSLYLEGVTAKMLAMLRNATGIDGAWLRSMVPQDLETRRRAVDERIAPVLNQPHFRAFLSSPAQLVSLGINFEQRDRLLSTENTNMVDYIVTHVKRVAETDLETNWFAWYVSSGGFNHESPNGAPPYLRKDRHERSYRAPTETTWRNMNLFDALAQGEKNTWSHYTLCDAPDWMPAPVQRKLLEEILRTSRDGAIVLSRTVEENDIVERAGLERHFRLLPESAAASREDRSRQYRRVNFYEVSH